MDTAAWVCGTLPPVDKNRGECVFGLKTQGPLGKEEVTRREFLVTGAKIFGCIPLLGFFGRPLFQFRLNFYQRAWRRRDFSAAPVTVFKMVALPGQTYSKADAPHMANKVFPSIEAARARRQHKAFLYGLKRIELPRSLVNGMDGDTLFCRRNDLDCRVAKDRRHWQRLGVDVDKVFRVVRNA
jgi:hypothetical protein